ncbi:sensor domain-containing diguanylate cyclase [Sphingobium algorifonticola]|jgi:diguanylate cyclase (GGDEF)-like protein/PAS domain S-box-containing protein|uniref:Sensor domain-containing diguanylate cyclase n=1 Tax=Sphingobium algorifonticola TaxID=2008318 RepID=A0A437J2A8_9SPHN|nr:sensor domain-containing diguanylate cyclase [Sphingobium algorifonticola]RVT38262.1 sensor domain-containing diguanylate cyclase [Sphingobium algorifonticola]
MATPLTRIRRSPALHAAVSGIGYFLCAALSLRLSRFDGGIAIIWLAGAFLTANLLAAPRRYWRFVIMASVPGAFAAGALFGMGGTAGLLLPATALLEGIAVAFALRRVYPRFGRLESLREVAAFLGLAGFVIPALGGLVSGWAAHRTMGLAPFHAWHDWYAGHALGFIAFTPALLFLLKGRFCQQLEQAGKRSRAECAGLLGAVALASVAAFGQSEVPLVLLPFVPMLAATFRLGPAGAALSVTILMVTGLVFTLLGTGPTMLLHASPALRLQVLQIYFASTVLILLPVAAELRARHRLFDRLRSSEALHRLILDRASDLVLRVSADGFVRYASLSCTPLLGIEPSELIGRSLLDIVHGADRPAVVAARTQALGSPEETITVEFRISRPDGSLSWVESHIRAALGEGGRVMGTVSVVREITKRRQKVAELKRQAETDTLTGLANRRALSRALDRHASEKSPAAPGYLAMFDLDHFKAINDRYGHAAGDAVLVTFAEILRSAVRQDDVVARLGGEEFVVLLKDATAPMAEAICQRIRSRFAEAALKAVTGQTIEATVSAGIARLGDGAASSDVLALADAALYRAKANGRNQLQFAA